MRWPWSQAQDYRACVDEIVQLKRELKTLETRVLGLELEQNTFRNKVLRKIQGPRSQPDAAEEAENKAFYSGVLIPEKE